MKNIDTIYVDGAFVTPKGDRRADLFNPATEEKIGTVRLGNEEDANDAVAAAKRALPSLSRSTPLERIAMLKRLEQAVASRAEELTQTMMEEYGAPVAFAGFVAPYAASIFGGMAKTLETFEFERRVGTAEVMMVPVGVVAAITPWNANYIFICSKFATALAAGCPIVVKPSEMSALQTQIITECIHAADIPKGVFNVINGDGAVVGAVLSSHPDIAKVTFTGSTGTGKAIMRAGVETMKRVTLELGGKSPSILLDDADLDQAISTILRNGFLNSGQACIAGTRILVPQHRMAEVEARLKEAASQMKVGDPLDESVSVGPMVSAKQWERVQSYIHLGIGEGAEVLVGGEGLPDNVECGWFVKPTIFTKVNNSMRIAREEIFGPVLCIIPYRDEAEAVQIANDTEYGLKAYVLSSNVERAKRVAAQLMVGSVNINDAQPNPSAPFGGFKQSGIGRENGVFGLEAFLEARTVAL